MRLQNIIGLPCALLQLLVSYANAIEISAPIVFPASQNWYVSYMIQRTFRRYMGFGLIRWKVLSGDNISGMELTAHGVHFRYVWESRSK